MSDESTSSLAVAWHGTRLNFSRLDVEVSMKREGYGQHGTGLYLTSARSDAFAYVLPDGVLWQCEVETSHPGVRIIELGDGITHYVVVDQAAVRSIGAYGVRQCPPRKLGHRERKAADKDPQSWGLEITRLADNPLQDVSR